MLRWYEGCERPPLVWIHNLFDEIIGCDVRYYNRFHNDHEFVRFGFGGLLVFLKWSGGFLLNLCLVWEARKYDQ